MQIILNKCYVSYIGGNLMVKEHFLIKNAVDIPKEYQLKLNETSDNSRLIYLTKTKAAPGDDDDYQGVKEVWYSWESLFS